MGSYMEISLQARKFTIMSMNGCIRSVRRHPFLVSLVLFLIFLYRSFPLLFSLLLSASPVLVCTAVLLGTLLSFGQSNVPEIEKDEVFTRDTVSLRAKVSRNKETFVVERDASFSVERYDGDRTDFADKSVEDDTRSVDVVDSLDRVPLINENSREIRVKKLERGLLDFEFEKKTEVREEEARIEEGALSDGKIVENHYSLVLNANCDENVEAEVDELHEKSIEGVHEDCVESSRVSGGDANEDDNDEDDNDDDEEEEEEDEDGSSGSDSDRAESSSPDASMADIIPMLDELHPLLDLDAPQPPHMSHGESESESDSGSEHSHGNGESDGEAGNRGDDVEEDDDHEDYEEEEEEAHEEKEDESKSAIKWTEDDQKNLMDLGTSEIERNQRLENLIARRRARKSFRMMAEKNLIDLDSADLPFNVPQISTARRNPFDLPDDSYDHMGLPPIPGSAPSILLPRRNPFDLPYDSTEEKPNLKGDNFEHEFLPPHQREMMFRRHESFILGPSGLGASSRSDARWRPVFVPERMEGTSFSLFQRQSSEVSESKLSSVLDDTDSGSVGDADEKKFSDRVFSREDDVHSDTCEGSDVAEHGSQSSKDEDDFMGIISEGRGISRDEIEIMLGEVESQHDTELDVSESLQTVDHLEHNDGNDIHVEAERVDDERDSSRSSVSLFSDLKDARIPDVNREPVEEEGDSGRLSLSSSSKMSDSKCDDSPESLLARDDSLEDSNLQFVSGMVDDHEHKEPVYDSSPHAADRLISLTSISFETQEERTELLNPPASGQVTEPRDINKPEPVIHESERVRDDIVNLRSVSLDAKSPEESWVNEEENNPNKHDHETHKTVSEPQEGASLHGQISSTSVPAVVDHAPVFSNLLTSKSEPFEFWEIVRQEMIHSDHHQVQSNSSSEKLAVEDEMFRDELVHPEHDEDPISRLGSEIQVESYRDLGGTQLEFPDSSHRHTTSGDSNSLVVAQVSEENDHAWELPAVNHESVQSEVPVEEKVLIEVEREKDPGLLGLSWSSEASSSQSEEKQDSDLKIAASASQEKSPSKLDKELSIPKESVVEPCETRDIELREEPATVMEEARGDSSIRVDTFNPEIEVLATLPTNYSDSSAFPSGSFEYKPLAGELDLNDSILDWTVDDSETRVSDHADHVLEESHGAHQNFREDADDISDIDEELLSELDVVGDFGIKEVGNSDLVLEALPSNASSIPKGTSTELPFLEARSFEDIDLAFKQLREGTDLEVVEAHLDVEESECPREIDSEIQVVEANKSLEDIEVAPTKVPDDGDMDKLKSPVLNSKMESSSAKEVGVNGVDFVTEIEPDKVESSSAKEEQTRRALKI